MPIVSLKARLFIATLSILIITQTITSVWLWHEAQEQIEILSRTDLTEAEVAALIAYEKWESVFAFLLPALFCVLVSSAAIYWSVKRLTQPLEQLAREVDRRTVQDLAPLTMHDDVSIEIKTIIDSTNQLLQRIAQGVEHERAFTMDVAHELRTPLAGIRMHLELLQSQQPERITPLITRLDDIIQLTVQLLELARASQQSRIGKLNFPNIDLVEDVCLPLADEYNSILDLSIIWQLPTKAVIKGSSPLLQVALRNLLDNARKYAGFKAIIKVALKNEGSQWALSVHDNGPGVPVQLIEQITESFFRADQRAQGYGLGLSIVKRIAGLHQVGFTISNHPDNGLYVRLDFNKCRTVSASV